MSAIVKRRADTVGRFTAANIQSFACLTGPTVQGGTDAFSGCKVPTQYYTYIDDSKRWSNELRLQSKPGSRLQWLAGLYWEKTRDQYSNFYYMPGIQPAGEAYQSQISYYNYYYAPNHASPLPHEWYSYKSRFDYLETTEFADLTFSLTGRWSVEGGVEHYVPYFSSSANVRYEKTLSAAFKAYAQYDIAHKGDMWSDLRVVNTNCFGRTLQRVCSIAGAS